MREVVRLSEAVHNELRSSIIIGNLGQLVEELACNSIDAGAKTVQVCINPTTCGLRVSDDGHGISRDSLGVLGIRHATSKLRSLEDLEGSPTTLGFRGEALSSIAQVASLTVTSKQRGAQPYRKVIKGGKVLSLELALNARLTKVGTSVEVQDLFFNQPVRRRQLWSKITQEIEHLKERLLRLAFIHTEVSFELSESISQKRILYAPQADSACDLVEYLYGQEPAADLQPLDHAVGLLRVSGCISKGVGQATKGLQYFYVNKRYVTHTPLHKLLDTRFADLLETRHFGAAQELLSAQKRRSPSYILNLDCPCSDYDITFEPTKSHIEFRDWSSIISFFQKALDVVWGTTDFDLAMSFDSGGDDILCQTGLQPPERTLHERQETGNLEMKEETLPPWACSPQEGCYVKQRPTQSPPEPSISLPNLAPEDSINRGLPSARYKRIRHSLDLSDVHLPSCQDSHQRHPEASVHRAGKDNPEVVTGTLGAPAFDEFDKLSAPQAFQYERTRRSEMKFPELGTAFEDDLYSFNSSSPRFRQPLRGQTLLSFDSPFHEADNNPVPTAQEDGFWASQPCFDMHFEATCEHSEVAYEQRLPEGCLSEQSLLRENKREVAKLKRTADRESSQEKRKVRKHSSDKRTRSRLKQKGCDNDDSEKAVLGKRFQKSGGMPLQKRPQSAPPFARPKKSYAKSGASLETPQSIKVTRAQASTEAIKPEVKSPSKWRHLQESHEVQELYKAWQNPCFQAGDKDVLMLEPDGHPGLVPKEITYDMLQHLRVFQQVDKKIIAAVAGGALIIIDQHAADERIRLEELREEVLVAQASTSINSASLKVGVKLTLTPIDEQVLRTQRSIIERWGWKYAFEDVPLANLTRDQRPGHSGPVLLTAVPSILDATLTASDLLDFLQQLRDTGSSSSVPSSVIRLLNSKACRGAIMFGDLMLPGECLQLIRHLQRTQMPFQCAHGRPTMVPLVNMDKFAQQFSSADIEADGQQLLRGLSAAGDTARQVTAGSTAARGLSRSRIEIRRARDRLDEAVG